MAKQKETLDWILVAVSRELKVPVSALRSRSRAQHVTFTRQIAYYLCRQLTNSSFPEIGKFFNRDHGTVIYGWRKISQRVKTDEAFKLLIRKLKFLVLGENWWLDLVLSQY